MPKPSLSHAQKEWAYEKWCEGYNLEQIADALYVCTKTIQRAINGRPRIRPILKYNGLEKDTFLLCREIADLQEKNKDLETESAINKGAMRAYREACENAQDEAVKDFCHFLIDKAKDGNIAIDELPDLVIEWGSPSRKSAEVMKEVNTAFDEARESLKPSPTLNEGSITGKSWYDARFSKVE